MTDYNEHMVRGCNLVLSGALQTTPETKLLARLFLDITYKPKQLPVPLEYFSVASAIIDPYKWYRERGSK